ncbi:MAG: flavodoxin family protein [Bacteroidales bacterium]|nr:flavodoxin family protein [Bacteroidales bacterium]
MKVVAINGSPRKKGNTELLIREVLKVLEKKGIETEFIQLGGKKVKGCVACMICKEKKDGQCHKENDLLNKILKKMSAADGVLIGSPVYFSDITSETKALLDVAGYALRAAGNPLKRKAGAAVVAVRRAGAIHTFDSINHFFLINEMIIPGSSYWNIGIGKEKGDVLKDEEGLKTMRVLGENMAWLLKTTNGKRQTANDKR